MATTPRGEWVGLPPRVFLYSLDQISEILAIPQERLERDIIWFDGRTTGASPINFLLARNVASLDAVPLWRVAEAELVRWMKRKGFRFYERGWPVQ